MDAQELLLNQKELQHLGRIWRDVASFSDFMETLRRTPSVVSGKKVKGEQRWRLCKVLNSHQCFVDCFITSENNYALWQNTTMALPPFICSRCLVFYENLIAKI